MKKITLFTTSRPAASYSDIDFQSEVIRELTEGEAAAALHKQFDILADGELEISFKWVPKPAVAKNKDYLALQAKLENRIKQAKIRRYYGRHREDILSKRKEERVSK